MPMESANRYHEKLTCRVVFACYIVSFFGWLVGYSGILGQVSGEDAFYDIFYSDVSGKNPRDYDYCKYGNRYSFPVMGGPLYLAAALASILSYPLPVKYGCRMCIIIAGVVSLIGAAIGVYPMFPLLLASQIILGFGVGLGVQVALIYISEMAPAWSRGAMSAALQLWIAIGFLGGNMMRRGLDQETEDQGWKMFLSFALPLAPTALIIWGGSKYVPEAPNSLPNHCISAKSIFQRRNLPQLALAVLMPIFQSITGAVFVLFYAPLLFYSLGSGLESSTYSTAINGGVLVFSALVSMLTVDRIGRKVLLISGGVIMFLCQVVIAILLGSEFASDKLTTNRLSIILTVLIAIFVMAYGWSWGPLGWTIPSETFTHETRPIGTSITVSINFVLAYLVLQFFVPLLCAFKYGLFIFFAGWIVVMTIFVCLFLPETKGVHIEETDCLWSKHWFWKRFVAQDSHQTPHSSTSAMPKHVRM